jgi:hypothetical protein
MLIISFTQLWHWHGMEMDPFFIRHGQGQGMPIITFMVGNSCQYQP